MHENGECVVWTGCVSKQGYGQFRYKDPRDPPSAGHKTRTSHRIALLLHMKDFDIPSYLQSSHLCNNKLCVNIRHLTFEQNSTNNLRKSCFLQSRCFGHYDVNGNRLPDCLIHLKCWFPLQLGLRSLICVKRLVGKKRDSCSCVTCDVN